MVKWTCAGKVPTFEIVDLSVEGEFNKINTCSRPRSFRELPELLGGGWGAEYLNQCPVAALYFC